MLAATSAKEALLKKPCEEAIHAELKLRDASRLFLAWLREATDDVVRAP